MGWTMRARRCRKRVDSLPTMPSSLNAFPLIQSVQYLEEFVARGRRSVLAGGSVMQQQQQQRLKA